MKMKVTDQKDDEETQTLNQDEDSDEQKETENSKSKSFNENDEDSSRMVRLQSMGKSSVGINLIRASVDRSDSELEDRPRTWPHPGAISSKSPISFIKSIQESPVSSHKSLGSNLSKSSPSLTNSYSLDVTRASPTPSIMSITEDEEGMEHAIMKENSWEDFFPTEVQNNFIKALAKLIITGEEKYSK